MDLLWADWKLVMLSRDLTCFYSAMLCWKIFQPVLWSSWSSLCMSRGSDIHYSIIMNVIESLKTMSMEKESTVVLGKNKALSQTWNKASTKQGKIVWDVCNYLCKRRIKNNEKGVFHYIKLTNQLSFKTCFQNVDQHTGGKWLIPSTKHQKNNQLQSLELPCRVL